MGASDRCSARQSTCILEDTFFAFPFKVHAFAVRTSVVGPDSTADMSCVPVLVKGEVKGVSTVSIIDSLKSSNSASKKTLQLGFGEGSENHPGSRQIRDLKLPTGSSEVVRL